MASGKKINEIGEKGLIKIITEILGELGNSIIKGEDDAVAMEIPTQSENTLIINTDMLVGSTDVPQQMNYFQAGRKAVIMTASDVVVKGALARSGVVSLGLPPDMELEGKNGFKSLIKGLKNGFMSLDINYLGGDLNETKELIVSCTIFGTIEAKKVIPRSGAQYGDYLAATGKFGLTGCGFKILLEGVGNESDGLNSQIRQNFINSVLNPEVSTEYGPKLSNNKWANASADSSDGLHKTISEICEASNVGAIIDWEKVPIAEGVLEFAKKNNLDPIPLIFEAGEEFIHIFTIPENHIKSVKEHFKAKKMPFYVFGNITNKPNKIIINFKDNSSLELLKDKMGYQHFRN